MVNELGSGCMKRLLPFLLLFLWTSVLASDVKLDPADQKALEALEQQITDLKRDVHLSKMRVHELEEAVLRGKITGSKAHIVFDNQAEGFFAFVSAEFFLDGDLIMKVDGKGRKSPLEKLDVFDKDLPPGEHTLEAKINFEGNEKAIHTAFSYFKDHKFRVETREKFPVEYGKTTLVKLTAIDQGYFKTELSERLHLKFELLKNWGSTLP